MHGRANILQRLFENAAAGLITVKYAYPEAKGKAMNEEAVLKMQASETPIAEGDERVEMLRAYAQSSALFTHLLLDLPDASFVDGIEGFSFGTQGECEDESDDALLGMALVDRYIAASAGHASGEVLTELSVDRTRLLRGLTVQGPRPPYESLYTGLEANDSVRSVKEAYRAANCHVAESVKDAPEHLGFEVAFIGKLAAREADALVADDAHAALEARGHAAAFMCDHLGRWCSAYADEMLRFATTDFYRGIAHLLRAYAEEGQALYA